MAANNNLSDFLTSVADALRSKGGTDQPINAQDFPSVIANLPSGGGKYHGLTWGATQTEPFAWNDTMKEEAETLNSLGKFSSVMRVTKVAGKIDLSGFTSFQTANAFYGCSGITEIDLHNVATITNMTYAFQNCGEIEKVDLSSLTENITSGTASAFRGCTVNMIYIHPKTLAVKNSSFNILFSSGKFLELRLTAIADNDLHLSNSNYILLESASILDVLQHLSTTAEGLTCEFHATAIKADDPNHDAIAALVDSLTNWTITGLTIA